MQVVMFTRFLRRMASLAFVLNSNLMLKPFIANVDIEPERLLMVLYLLKKLALVEQL